MTIIGYIHICQIGEWERSLNMLINAIVESGLYEQCAEIRCGILNHSRQFVKTDNSIWQYSKLTVVYVGDPQEYERPTLLHMKRSAEIDSSNTKYFYVHTKGLRWFGTPSEPFVVDWIKLLIYWNITKWRDAERALDDYDVYGCNYYKKDAHNPSHYSGNFFWVTQTHLNRLPNTIGHGYNDPEFWLCSGDLHTYYNAFSSGYEGMGHYTNLFPESNYIQ